MPSRMITAVISLSIAVFISGCQVASTEKAVGAPAISQPTGDVSSDLAMAFELQRTGEHVRSVPFFESVTRATPDESEPHVNLCIALNNASIQTDLSGGAVRYAVARSQDRAQLRREALTEIRKASGLSRTPDDRAYAWSVESRVLALMGRPLEARSVLERALELRPAEPALLASAARLDHVLQRTGGRRQSDTTRIGR